MKLLLLTFAVAVLTACSCPAAGTNEVIRLDDKTTISAYAQGRITIGGRLIRTDILVFPDGTVQQDWSTATNHVLSAADIAGLLEVKSDMLVIGTGHDGLMRPAAGLMKVLKEKGQEFVLLKTDDAIKKLKALRLEGKSVCACLHIGC